MMQLAVKILDKTTDGKLYQESSLKLVSERTTLREILEKRIQQEAERKLNGFRLRKPRRVSYQSQIELAVEAFQGGGFFVLFNDRQRNLGLGLSVPRSFFNYTASFAVITFSDYLS